MLVRKITRPNVTILEHQAHKEKSTLEQSQLWVSSFLRLSLTIEENSYDDLR